MVAKGTQTKKQIIKTIHKLEDDTRKNRLNLDDHMPLSQRSVVSWNNDIIQLKIGGIFFCKESEIPNYFTVF